MADVEHWLWTTRLRGAHARIAAGAGTSDADAAWRDAQAAVSAAGAAEDADIALPVLERDTAALATLLVKYLLRKKWTSEQ